MLSIDFVFEFKVGIDDEIGFRFVLFDLLVGVEEEMKGEEVEEEEDEEDEEEGEGVVEEGAGRILFVFFAISCAVIFTHND